MSFDPWPQWQSFAALMSAPARPPAPGSDFASFATMNERFGRAAARYFDAARDSPAAAAAAAQNFGDFLRDEFAALAAPAWQSGKAPRPQSPDHEAAALGPTRAHQARAQRAASAWRRLDDAQRRLQRLWSDALREAALAFQTRLAGSSAVPPSAQAFQGLYDSWIDCAEEAYARAAHSEAFCDAIADSINAGSEWRRETQIEAEAWAKLWDLPTRTEINALTERLRSVEEALRAQPQGREPPQKPRPARRKGKPR